MRSRVGAVLQAGIAFIFTVFAALASGSTESVGILALHTRAHFVAPAASAEALARGNTAAGSGKVYTGTPIDVTTFHYDINRSGWNATETDLTQANVAANANSFGLLQILKVDGLVLAQPLLVAGFTMPDGSIHDVLLVATEHNSLYAFDANTFAVLWQKSLGTSQNGSDVGCGDVVPEYGISSTPVIVRGGPSQATVYVVAATETGKGNFQVRLHALNLGTGGDLVPPAVINPQALLSNGALLQFDEKNEWNRAGLVWANRSIYVGIGSHCDVNYQSDSGWLLRFGPGLRALGQFNTISNANAYELAGIWMAGFAPAVDAAGNLYFATGNGAYDGQGDFGESVLTLTADLSTVRSTFTPANYQSLNDFNDFDVGSGGVMLLPTLSPGGTPLAVAMGKPSDLYLLDQNALGGLQTNNAGALQVQHVPGAGIWGGPAYYDGPGGPMVFYQVTADLLRGFSLSTATTPQLTDVIDGTTTAGYGGSNPIVSSNGAVAGTGIVWVLRHSSPLSLEAYDADTLGAPIFSATAGTWNQPEYNALISPLEANGRVYVASYKTVYVFGLTSGTGLAPPS